jgi:hypothetical protein
MKLTDRFFKNRVKPIVITQLLLLIPVLVLFILSFTADGVKNISFLSGVQQILLAVFMLLMAIEQYILKKRGLTVVYIILTIVSLSVVIQTFYVISVKS